ncbi:hypothetical protein H696_05793 [Fonticula alba]|uniref:Uncharacterized protein n=1 Tax=Fonticula alba TaxID=691883 RepID=A0A058Z164_FONAL|nr:hypothetical protein H696_05793 [Fonticula alba]KCV67683.1 hypothetical protein H696_05793 [Fonticula alba]|eukprot:XP_009497867.1 hypothetical protein H696_05793 [Fonticula alba]
MFHLAQHAGRQAMSAGRPTIARVAAAHQQAARGPEEARATRAPPRAGYSSSPTGQGVWPSSGPGAIGQQALKVEADKRANKEPQEQLGPQQHQLHQQKDQSWTRTGPGGGPAPHKPLSHSAPASAHGRTDPESAFVSGPAGTSAAPGFFTRLLRRTSHTLHLDTMPSMNKDHGKMPGSGAAAGQQKQHGASQAKQQQQQQHADKMDAQSASSSHSQMHSEGSHSGEFQAAGSFYSSSFSQVGDEKPKISRAHGQWTADPQGHITGSAERFVDSGAGEPKHERFEYSPEGRLKQVAGGQQQAKLGASQQEQQKHLGSGAAAAAGGAGAKQHQQQQQHGHQQMGGAACPPGADAQKKAGAACPPGSKQQKGSKQHQGQCD